MYTILQYNTEYSNKKFVEIVNWIFFLVTSLIQNRAEVYTINYTHNDHDNILVFYAISITIASTVLIYNNNI